MLKKPMIVLLAALLLLTLLPVGVSAASLIAGKKTRKAAIGSENF